MHPLAKQALRELLPLPPLRRSIQKKEKLQLDLREPLNFFMETSLRSYPDVQGDPLREVFLHTAIQLLKEVDHSFYYKALSSENCLLTNGAVDALDLVLSAFLEPDESVCIPWPSFSAFVHRVKVYGGKIHPVALQGADLNTFDIDPLSHSRGFKLILLCDPNNPTSTRLESGLLQRLCASFSGLIIVDETYVELSDRNSSLELLPYYPNLVILRSLSKSWGLAALRCGFILAHPEIISTLHLVQTPFRVSQLSQEKALSLFRDINFLKLARESWVHIKNSRTACLQDIQESSVIQYAFNSETNFITLQLKDMRSFLKRLKDRNISVDSCHPDIPSAIRVAVSTPTEMGQFLECCT